VVCLGYAAVDVAIQGTRRKAEEEAIPVLYGRRRQRSEAALGPPQAPPGHIADRPLADAGGRATCAEHGAIRYRLCMTIVQTVLVFVGIPAAIISVIAFAVYGKSLLRQPNRYRPGRPWPYAASWFVPHPDAVLRAGSGHPQLEAGPRSTTTAVGGASGEW
jgi:hypothetical protein